MGKFSDNLLRHEISIPCPGCKRVNKATLKQVQSVSQIRCSGCGKTIRIDKKGDDLSKVSRAMDDFERSLRKLGGR